MESDEQLEHDYHAETQAKIGETLDHMAEAGIFSLDLAYPSGKRQFVNAILQSLLIISGAPATLVSAGEIRVETPETDKAAAVAAFPTSDSTGGETQADPEPVADEPVEG